MDFFKNKTILVTGGTGTIGQELIDKILSDYSPKAIRIYSRDETKQFYLAKKFKDHQQTLRYFIGDIRDKDRLNRAMKDVDILFHLAALKHVVACEYNPFEAIKTNVLGIQNLAEVSIDHNIEKFVFTSSDKAATPSNTMGVTKLLGEKLVTAANYYSGTGDTIFYSVRFGNVLGTRGSLIPLVEEQIKNNVPITITDKEMTRYIISINEAVDLIINTFPLAQGGEVFVAKMNAVKILDLIEVLADHFSKKHNKKVDKIQLKEIGMFAGEKLYEELFSIEESNRTYEYDDLYIIVPQITEVSSEITLDKYSNIAPFDTTKPFSSRDGGFLSKEEILDFLLKENILQDL